MFPTLASRKSASSRIMMQEEHVGFTLQDIDQSYDNSQKVIPR